MTIKMKDLVNRVCFGADESIVSDAVCLNYLAFLHTEMHIVLTETHLRSSEQEAQNKLV